MNNLTNTMSFMCGKRSLHQSTKWMTIHHNNQEWNKCQHWLFIKKNWNSYIILLVFVCLPWRSPVPGKLDKTSCFRCIRLITLKKWIEPQAKLTNMPQSSNFHLCFRTFWGSWTGRRFEWRICNIFIFKIDESKGAKF